MGSSTAKGIISQINTFVNSKNILRYLPDDIPTKNKIVYDKKKMNGKYQVGSGRVVTLTHDSPFIYKDDTTSESNSQEEPKIILRRKATTCAGRARRWIRWLRRMTDTGSMIKK